MRIVRHILALSILCCILSGCHRKGLSFHKKLYFKSQSSPIEQPLGIGYEPFFPQPINHISPTITSVKTESINPTITIWIHGAQPFKPNSYNLGLKPAGAFRDDDELGILATTLSNSDPIRFPFDHLYFFSWSGKLCFKERKQASRLLYQQLLNLIANYEQKHKTRPAIRIITHSHGGNVALNLAKINDKNLIVEELILLACPVQDKTALLTKKTVFKSILSLYSTLDVIQVIDPQGLYPDRIISTLFSHQRFDPQPNLLQVKVRINGHSCLHHEFHDTPFIAVLSQVIDQLHLWQSSTPAQAYLAHHARFVLSIYTNGRMPPRHKNYRNKNQENIVLQSPVPTG